SPIHTPPASAATTTTACASRVRARERLAPGNAPRDRNAASVTLSRSGGGVRSVLAPASARVTSSSLMVRSWWSPPAAAKQGAGQRALGGARLDRDETGDFLVRVPFDVVQDENFAEGGWQAIEAPSDVRARVGISRSARVVESHMPVPVGPPPPLAIAVQGDP